MYTDPVAALAALKNLPAIRGLPTTEDDQFLTDLLEASAGQTNSITVYRIYYTAARFLQQPRGIHLLESTEKGVKFTGLTTPIISLFALQLAEDEALNLLVPDGYSVPSGVPGISSFPLMSSRSITAVMRP